jgi:hypothetical protein
VARSLVLAACFACFTRSPAWNAVMSSRRTHPHRPTRGSGRAALASSRSALLSLTPSATRSTGKGSKPSRTVPVTILVSAFGPPQHVDGCSRERLLMGQQAAEWPGLILRRGRGHWGVRPGPVACRHTMLCLRTVCSAAFRAEQPLAEGMPGGCPLVPSRLAHAVAPALEPAAPLLVRPGPTTAVLRRRSWRAWRSWMVMRTSWSPWGSPHGIATPRLASQHRACKPYASQT